MSAEITIDATDFARAAQAFGADFDVEAGLLIEDAVRDSAEAVQRNVRAQARRHRRTGRLEKFVGIKYKGAGLDFEGTVKSGGSVAHLVAGHVKPHAIRSLTKAMPIRVEGNIVTFRQAVQHPGSHGDPYFHRGVQSSIPFINATLAEYAGRLAEELARKVAP